MSPLCRNVFFLGLLAGLAFLFPMGKACNAQGKPDPVKIPTIDGVELHGSFYQSTKKNAPTVICLHAIGAGESSAKKGWTFLAESLQPNFSVMLFDFRGHGKSTVIDPAIFWKFGHNASSLKGSAKRKETIDYKDFSKSYYPTLANDLAAVKAFLDRQNDRGMCNTSNTILIGAENGATLGAVWLNAQWSLYRVVGNPLINLQTAPNPEGRDIVACVWLSIIPKLGTTDVTLSKTLATAAKTHATPMVFMYGDKDTAGMERAKALTKVLTEKENKYKLTAAVAVEGNTKLGGEKLLQKALKTDEAINDYLASVIDQRGREWAEREFSKNYFVWRMGNLSMLRARNPEDGPNFVYDTYDKFIR